MFICAAIKAANSGSVFYPWSDSNPKLKRNEHNEETFVPHDRSSFDFLMTGKEQRPAGREGALHRYLQGETAALAWGLLQGELWDAALPSGDRDVLSALGRAAA